jgi:hypothetical protein
LTPLLAQTPADEMANLQAIATDLAQKPQLEQWAVANADIANHVGDIHRLYPWLPPGVTLALGTARYAVDDPFVKSLADSVMQFGRKANLGNATQFLSDADVQKQLDTGILGGAIPGVTPTTHQGLLDRGVSDVTGAVSRVATDLGSGIPESVRTQAKSDVRWGMAGLQSGLEGIGAAYRAGVTMTKGLQDPSQQTMEHPSTWDRLTSANVQTTGESPLPQLTIVQALNGKSMGQGFFPAGEARTAAQQAQFLAANAGGHALTPGRSVAGMVFPANSKAYGLVSGLADAAVALYGDPAQHALAGFGDLRDAGFLRASGGAVSTADPTGGIVDQVKQVVGIRTVQQQLDSRAGQGIIQRLTDMNQFRDVHAFLGGKTDAQISLALANTTTPEATRAILEDGISGLGAKIERLPSVHPLLQAAGTKLADLNPLYNKPWTDAFGNVIDHGIGTPGYLIQSATRDWRPLADLPGGMIHSDLSQPWYRNAAIKEAEAHMVNAHTNPGDIESVLREFAGASNPNEVFAATDHMLAAEAKTLVDEYGVTPQEAHRLTTWSSGRGNLNQQLSGYFKDSLVNKDVVPGIMNDGKPVMFTGPGLLVEHLDNNIMLPDFREIRRAASSYRQFIISLGGQRVLNGVDRTTGALDALMHAWKFAQIARPALTVRTLGESQLAMAANGDASAFSNLADYLGFMVGRKGAFDPLGNKLDTADFADVFRNGARDVLGFDPNRMAATRATQLLADQPGFRAAWGQEMRTLTIDYGSREAAKAIEGGPQAIQALKDSFFNGPMRKYRLSLMENGDPWRDPAVLGQRAVSDAYVERQLIARVIDRTRGDGELVSAIAHNDFRGDPLAQMKDGVQLAGKAKYETAPQSLLDRLGELHASGDHPDFVRGTLLGKGGRTGLGLKQDIGNFETHFFNGFMTTPHKVLAVSPFYRQEIYREIDKLLPFMDPTEAEKIVAGSEKAGIMGLDASKAAGSLDAVTANTIAKSRALASLPKILHDLGNKSQMSDMLRFVFPFGDAYKKVITRWATLVAEKPATIERFRQGMNEGQQSGFVHTDAFGKQVFTIPFTQQLDGAITGLPFPQDAPLNGLSIVGSGLPGIGPALSVPLGLLAPHVPVLADALSKIAPQGTPNVRQGVLEAFLPGWANRLRTAGMLGPVGPSADEQSTFMHTVDDALRYGVSAGKYKMDTPTDIASAVADARHKATLLFTVRGMIQFISPSPPSPQIMVKDKSGRLTAAYVLANELQYLYAGKGVDGKSHNDPRQATQIFLRLHGDSNYLMLQPFTTPRRYGLPSTTDMASWLTSHGGFQKAYPNVYGMLVPQKGAFDYSLYQGQIHSGERVDRTSEDFVRLANARVAAMIYDTQRNQLPDNASSADKSGYLAELRTWLVSKYPGYQDQSLQQPKVTVPAAIDELSRAVLDPAVRNTLAAKAVRAYLALRQQVIDFEKANGATGHGNSLSTSQVFAAQHEWLSQQASRILDEYKSPDGSSPFFPVWDNLLSHEVTLAPTPNPAGV